ASHGLAVRPILVLMGAAIAARRDRTSLIGPAQLGNHLIESMQEGSIDLKEWLDAPYTPLPTLVAAARRIFAHQPLPHIRRALAQRLPETVDLLVALA